MIPPSDFVIHLTFLSECESSNFIHSLFHVLDVYQQEEGREGGGGGTGGFLKVRETPVPYTFLTPHSSFSSFERLGEERYLQRTSGRETG